MSGHNRARIEVRDKENVVLASSMLHRDVEARAGEFRDKDAVATARRDMLALSRKLEEMDSQSDLVDAMILGGLDEDAGQAGGSDVDDAAPLPQARDEAPHVPDILTESEDSRPALLDDESHEDDVPRADDLGGLPDLDMGEGFLDELPGDEPGDEPGEAGLPDLLSDDLQENSVEGLSLRGDPSDELQGDLPDPDADDSATGAGLDIDALLAQTGPEDELLPEDGDEPASGTAMNDPFDDGEEPRIDGLSLEDGDDDSGPIEIGQFDLSKLRARRGEAPLPSKKSAPLLLRESGTQDDDDAPALSDDVGITDGPDETVPGDAAWPEVLPSEEDAAPGEWQLPELAASETEESIQSDGHDDMAAPQDGPETIPEPERHAEAALAIREDSGSEERPDGEEIAFHKLTEDEAGAFEEISARAAELSDREDDQGEDGFGDDDLFAPDAPLDPYHDLDLGDADHARAEGADVQQDDGPQEDDGALPNAVTGRAAQMNVDDERERLAIFDLSGDNDVRKSDAGTDRKVEDEEADMKIPPLKRPARTSDDRITDEIEDQGEEARDALADEGDDEQDGSAADKPAKKSGKMGRMLRTAAIVTVVLGGGFFAASNFLGTTDLIGGARDLAGVSPSQSGGSDERQVARSDDPFAPIGGADGGFEPIDFDSLKTVDPRTLAEGQDPVAQTATLSEQLAEAAAANGAATNGQMTQGIVAPSMPAPGTDDVAPSLADLPDPVMSVAVPPMLQPQDDDDASIPASQGGELAFTYGQATAEATDEGRGENSPAPAPAPERNADADTSGSGAAGSAAAPAGSLDAAMAGFLSGYITSDELNRMMSAYTTSATTNEIEGRLQDYETRVQEIDAQIARLDDLESRISAAMSQAERAEQMALAQNDLVIDVVRMAGKVDMAESLIVDLSRRTRTLEEIEPIGRDVVDHTLTGLNERVEKLAHDMGLIAQLAYRGRADVAPQAAPAPTAAAGDVFARSPGSASAGARPPSRLDPSKIPADVKKGDVIEGYGHVLDVMPTERGKMVVTENDSVIIE